MLAFSLIVASCAGRIGSSGPDGSAAPAGEAIEPGEIAFAERPFDTLETLRLALARPDALEPWAVSMADQSAVIVSDLLYDGLTEAVGREGVLRPGLATEWTADEDLTRWRFELDPDRIEASQVVAHFEALATMEVSSSTTQLTSSIVDVVAVGETAVEFELDRPEAGFPWLLSGLAASVVGADGAYTGRFVPTEDTGQTLILSAVGDAPPTHPTTVQVQWTSIPDEAYDLLALGLTDAAVAPVEDLDDAIGRFGHEPIERSIAVFYGIALDDVDARRAVLAAFDTADLDDAVALLGAAPATGIFAPVLAGSRMAEEVGGTAGSGDLTDQALTSDPAALFDLELSVTYTDDGHAPVAQRLSERLAEAGVRSSSKPRSPSEQASAIAAGRDGVFAFGWVAPAGSLDAVARSMLAGDSASNVLGYRSSQIDELLAEAAVTVDDEARWALLADAHRLAIADARALPLGAALSQLVVAPQAVGLTLRADGSLDLEPAP